MVLLILVVNLLKVLGLLSSPSVIVFCVSTIVSCLELVLLAGTAAAASGSVALGIGVFSADVSGTRAPLLETRVALSIDASDAVDCRSRRFGSQDGRESVESPIWEHI
jgi:hypothetical protein